MIKLEEELRFCREHNAGIAERVQETGMILDKQKDIVNDKLAQLLEEKMAVEAQNQELCHSLKTKEENIKELTRENLTVKACLTQV